MKMETLKVEKKAKNQPILEKSSYKILSSMKFLDICISNGPKIMNKTNDPNASNTLFKGRVIS